MRLFNCQVRLAGNVGHAVPKQGVSEHEVIILRHLHGNDAVIDLKSAGESKASKRAELERLAGIYGVDVVETVYKTVLDLDTVIVEQDDAEDAPVIDADAVVAADASPAAAKRKAA